MLGTRKALLLFLGLAVVGALLVGALPTVAGQDHGSGKSLAQAREALEQELLPQAEAGFVGIAHFEEKGELVVFVEDEGARRRIPHSFGGYPVRTEVTGRIEAFSCQVMQPLADVSEDRREQVRPLVGGISLSAYVTKGSGIYLYAGTLGMVTYDDKILSNAHVIAMNPETGQFLPTGTRILQPGTADGGRLGDRVGTLQAYIPIDFDPEAVNYADAAVGSIDYGIEASAGEQFSEEGDYWIEGWTTVSTGNIVRKSGRTTGVTTGEVLYTNASVVVSYGGRSAYFEDQIVVAQTNWSFAKSGDSGSAVDKGGKFVGLVFAGSADRAVICKAERIIDGLRIAVQPPENKRSLTISSTSGGSVTTPGEGMFIYDVGEVVSLVAEADEHYHFVEWTGDVDTIGDVYAASTNITMSDSYSITANFELDEGWHSLSISSTRGGSVTTPGEGVYIYEDATVVELVAEADTANHYHFAEWSGDVSTVGNITSASTNITMNGSYAITANFELDEGWHSLDISSTDGGSVTSPGEGVFIYGYGQVVNLVAVAEEGYRFLRWTGDVSTIADVNAAETTITMDSSYAITASFESWHPQPMTELTISSTSGGSVVTPGEGTFSYPLGTEVSLVAEAVSGYRFIGWSGDVGTIEDVDAASTTITMDGSYSITANFGAVRSLCFIATAAYGTPMAEEIQVLREFRDEYLLTNPLGKGLVDMYYRVSPPIAEFITEHPGVRPIVRAMLVPAVAMSTIAVNATLAEKAAILCLLLLVSLAVAVWAARRRRESQGEL